jgi:2-oxoglutarate ferredoxin oxidoreductase subunit beta
MDRDPKHQREVLLKGSQHVGTSMIEIYQNCNVFNDGAFEVFTDKSTKAEETLFLEQGEPLVFGQEADKGIWLDGSQPKVVSLDEVSKNDLWVHNEKDKFKAQLLTTFFDNPADPEHLPRPFGVFYSEDRYRYEDEVEEQIKEAIAKKGKGNLDEILSGKNVWTVD